MSLIGAYMCVHVCYIQCVLHTVGATYSVRYIQCVLHTVCAMYIQCVLHTVCATYNVCYICVTVFVLSEWSKQCALMCVSACLDVLMGCILHKCCWFCLTSSGICVTIGQKGLAVHIIQRV